MNRAPISDKAVFGWLLPTGNQRMPEKSRDYFPHVQQVLELIAKSFHSAWISDHLMEDNGDIPEALVTLSHLATRFPELYLGTAVLSQSFRNPALLAKMAATLQNLSLGRFILGIGAGWKEDEYQAYGYEFPQAPIRIAQLAEAVQICKGMWDHAQLKTTFHGQYYQIEEAVCLPKPTLPIPVMIGGGGERLTLRVVAQHADWWNLPGASPKAYAQKLNVLDKHCSAWGRPVSEIRKTWLGTISIARTRQEAVLNMETYPSWPGDLPLLGTPSQIIAQIHEYTRLGVDLFILRFADEPKLIGLQLFLDHVLPAFPPLSHQAL